MRRVLASQWTRAGNHLLYHIEATSFLRHMVRTMVAAMAEAGRGQLNALAVDAILASRDRAVAPAPRRRAGSISAQSATDGAIVRYRVIGRRKPLGLNADANSLFKNRHDP